jgi:hypothetical protein
MEACPSRQAIVVTLYAHNGIQRNTALEGHKRVARHRCSRQAMQAAHIVRHKRSRQAALRRSTM